ncbi:hypothetical protein GQ457_18G008080 [Hibiscus cannabinus]
MATEDILKALEMNHKDMEDRLDKLEKYLKDEIAQAQKDTVSQIVAMLGFKDPERGKAVEAVDVAPIQDDLSDIFTKGKILDLHGGNLNPYSNRVRNESWENQGSEVLHRVGMNKNLEDYFDKLEEIIRAMQGGNIYGGVDARDLSLVTDLMTPPKFKIPEFEKDDGTTCHLTHLTMYCRRMSPYLENEKLLIHCVQGSLSGFVARYRIVLQDMEPRSNESFRQYARRWRDVAAQVQPPLLESEVTPMFVETLTGPFYDHMLNHATKDFAYMILNGEFILTTIRSGRLKEEEYDEH